MLVKQKLEYTSSLFDNIYQVLKDDIIFFNEYVTLYLAEHLNIIYELITSSLKILLKSVTEQND